MEERQQSGLIPLVTTVVPGSELVLGRHPMATARVVPIEPSPDGEERYDSSRGRLYVPVGARRPLFSDEDRASPWEDLQALGGAGGKPPMAVVYTPLRGAEPVRFRPPRSWRNVVSLRRDLERGLTSGDFTDFQERAALERARDLHSDALNEPKAALEPFASGGYGLDQWRAEQGMILWEPLTVVWAMLDVLAMLEQLVQLAREGDRPRLTQLFKERAYGGRVDPRTPRPQAPQRVLLAGSDRAPHPWQLWLYPWYDKTLNHYRLPYPNEAARAAWNVVLSWYQDFMEGRLRVTFDPSAAAPAFHAAVEVDSLAEWAAAAFFVAEVSRFNGVCERKGCPNPIPPTRHRWCSDECKNAAWQQKRRDGGKGTVQQAYDRAYARLRKRVWLRLPEGEDRERTWARIQASLNRARDEAGDDVKRFLDLVKSVADLPAPGRNR